MRQNKTSANNRTNYVYYFDDGSTFVIEPGENGENIAFIEQLHAMDDEEYDSNRRENYHCPVRYESYSNGETANDSNPYLSDFSSDALEIIIASIEEQEYLVQLSNIKLAIATLTDLQRKTIYQKFYLQMSNVAIAESEGVTEAAIRNRIKKIIANISKKI